MPANRTNFHLYYQITIICLVLFSLRFTVSFYNWLRNLIFARVTYYDSWRSIQFFFSPCLQMVLARHAECFFMYNDACNWCTTLNLLCYSGNTMSTFSPNIRHHRQSTGKLTRTANNWLFLVETPNILIVFCMVQCQCLCAMHFLYLLKYYPC